MKIITKRAGISQSRPIICNDKSCEHSISMSSIPVADWEPGHVLAELRSGRDPKDPALRYSVGYSAGIPQLPSPPWAGCI